MGKAAIEGCPILIGIGSRTLLFLTMECKEKKCDTTKLEVPLSRVLDGKYPPTTLEEAYAYALVFGGLMLFYKIDDGYVPVSRAQLVGDYCVELSDVGPDRISVEEALSIMSKAMVGNGPEHFNGEYMGQGLLVKKCSDGTCRPAPTGVSYY